jgi:hypothetical protein
MLLHEPADIVPVRGLDASLPQHALEGEFDDLLCLAHDVGVRGRVEQDREDGQPNTGFGQIALGERYVGHSSKMSPGW